MAAIEGTIAHFDSNPLPWVLLVERWGTISNRVSPLVPAFCLGMIPVLWAVCQLRRIYFLEIYPIESPFSADTAAAAGLTQRVTDLNRAVSRPICMPIEMRDWIFVGAVILGYGLLWHRWLNSVEGIWFDDCLWILLSIDLVLIGLLHVHFMAAAGLLERLLRRVAQSSVAPFFDKVPERLKIKAAGHIFAASPHPGDLDIVLRQLEFINQKETARPCIRLPVPCGNDFLRSINCSVRSPQMFIAKLR